MRQTRRPASAPRGLTQTAGGWRIRWTDHHHRKHRARYTDQEIAAAALAEERKWAAWTRTHIKLSRSQNNPQYFPPANLRCAQPKDDGTRCRRIATNVNTKNGRPTCQAHSAT